MNTKTDKNKGFQITISSRNVGVATLIGFIAAAFLFGIGIEIGQFLAR